MDAETLVVSLGGSLICPSSEPNIAFLEDFRALMRWWWGQSPRRRAVLITGGGGPARTHQAAAQRLTPESDHETLDWIGIRATWLNGELVRAAFGPDCADPLVMDPTRAERIGGRVLVAAGWKPGFSTDYDAVLLAERFGARTLLNLSNVERVYSADPKTDPGARPLDHLSWDAFQALVGTRWTPGANLPFDPIATARAREVGLQVVVLGPSVDNLRRFLEGGPFVGTRIGTEVAP